MMGPADRAAELDADRHDAPEELTDDRLPWCPTCEAIAIPDEAGNCGHCGSTVILR